MKRVNGDIATFLNKFCFRPELAGCIGIEREQFLISSEDGRSVPRAAEFLDTIKDPQWTYELSACQVESRTRPRSELSAIEHELLVNENRGQATAERLNLRLVSREVGDADMPLEAYPDPRYAGIVSTISKERLSAACRVTGTHVHIGARDLLHAFALHNAILPHFDRLCRMGDHSEGERLRLYKAMAVNWEPVAYRGPEHLFEIAKAEGFADNPRDCWKLMRISIHGTVELRMFGSADRIQEILEWIQFLKTIIREVP